MNNSHKLGRGGCGGADAGEGRGFAASGPVESGIGEAFMKFV
jgi:hypothetical protein